MNNYEAQRCKEYIKKLNRDYKNKHLQESEFDELIGENNVEKRDVKGYHGREIFELLQNADDAYQNSINNGIVPEKDLVVNIRYINNILTISNTGTLFSEAGIKSIVQGNNSPKSTGYIGNKGTGFRSILNWSNKIKIFSGYYKIEFSQEQANLLFEEIKEEKQIQKQLQKNKNLYIPILSAPKFIENSEKDYYNETIIEIFIEPNKIFDDYNVEKQINDIDLKILLFLPNVSTINIETARDIISYQREKMEMELNNKRNIENFNDQISLISLKKIINGSQLYEEYEVFERNIKKFYEENDSKKDIHLTIAVPYNSQAFSDHLYSYFPLLDTASPFSCVMHATYDLSDQRNTLNKSEINKLIILEQFKHLVDISNYYLVENDNIRALKVLTPTNINSQYYWKFNVGFSVFNVEDDYLSLLKDVKFFRNVNGELLSLNDNPKLIDDKVPDFIKGNQFNHLVKPFEDENLNIFIKMLSLKYSVDLTINEEDLKIGINNLTESLTAEEQVECFDWWATHYHNSLPNLLKKQDGSWINYGDECYFLDGAFGDMQLPKWVKVPAISMEYQPLLYAKARQNEKVIKLIRNGDTDPISRIISKNKIYPQVTFNYRDKSNIIPTINSSVDNYEKSLEFVKWLYDNYKSEFEWTPPTKSDNPTRYLFPTNDKTTYYADQLFFSSTYGNDLSKKMFEETFKEFVSFDAFNLDESEKENFISFISKFGIRFYPKIEKMKIKILEKSYEENLKKDIFSSQRQWMGMSTWISSLSCEFLFINNIEHILSILTMYEVVEWLYKDNNLLSALKNKYYLSDREYEIKYQGNSQHSYRPYNGKIRNYLLTVFNTSKWIEINDVRYSPKEVILELYNKNNKKFGNLVPILTRETLLKISQKLDISYELLVDLLKTFEFCEKVTDLSSNDFYKLLLLIPNEQNRNQSIEMSKSIYSIIERSDFNRIYEDSDNKKKFFRIGKVLTKKQEYHIASEVYLPSIKIVNRSKYLILDKGPRTNNEKFVEIFGCQDFKEEFKIIKNSIIIHPANPAFQEYYLEFKKYASAYGSKNSNIEKVISSLSITLVSQIEVNIETNSSIIADNYCEVRDSEKNWFIFIVDNTYDIIRLSESIENIFTNIANTPGFDAGKIGELFRTKDSTTREFLIEKEFGTLSVIDGKTFSEELEENFKQTVFKLNPNFDIENIDIDFNNFYDYESIEKIINIFKKLNIKSINTFMQNGFCYDFEFTTYYKQKMDVFINNEKRNYRNYIYNLAIKDEQMQHNFLKLCDEFEEFSIKNRIVEIIDIEEIMKAKFGDWSMNGEYLDSEEEYKKNYTLLNPNDVFQDEIGNNYIVREMIYFNLKEEFKVWYFKQEVESSSEKTTNNHYADYFNVIPKEEVVSYTDVHTMNVKKTSSSKNVIFSESAESKKREKKKILGNKGELLIYNYLKDKFGSENIFPRSEAFVSLGILKAGQAVSGDYDIEYIDPLSNNRYFVEVKTGEKNSFFISPSELDFAKKHKKEYILFVVYDLESRPPKFCKIEEEFWNNSHYKQEEIIEKIRISF